MPRLHAASPIRHVGIDDCRVILDLRSARYFILDPVAALMWRAILDEPPRERFFAEIAARCDVFEADLGADLKRFETQCVESGLLVVDGEQPDSLAPARAPRTESAWLGRFSFLSALHCLVATNRLLKKAGLYAVYRRCGQTVPGAPRTDLAHAVRRFGIAENFFVSSRAPDDCLSRSLALFRFLRRAGFSAEHVIGVRRVPFRAHAWVECDGEPVMDAMASRFTPIARLGAADAGTA